MAAVLKDSCEGSNAYGQVTSSNIWISESFTPATTYTAKRLGAKLAKLSGIGTMYFSLYLGDGSNRPTGAALATVSFSESELSAYPPTWIEKNLTVGLELTGGQQYCFVIHGDGSWYFARNWSGNPCAGMVHAISTDGGSSWTAYGSADMDFRVYEVTEVPSVSSVAANASFAGIAVRANLTDEGGLDVTKRGFAYSTSNPTPDPTTDPYVEETGSFDVGLFNLQKTGLPAGMALYVRPYCYNAEGYGYGSVMTVTLSSGASLMATNNARLVGYPSDISFAMIRNGSYLNVYAPEDSNPDNLCGARETMTASPWLFRGFLYFCIAGMTSDFTDVKLKLFGYEKGDGHKEYIVGADLSLPTTTTADFLESNSQPTILATIDGLTGDDMKVGEYAELSFNEDGVQYIRDAIDNGDPYVMFCVLTENDYDNNLGVTVRDLYWFWYLSQETGKEPLLEFSGYDEGGAVILEQAYSVAGNRQPIFTASPTWTDITEYLMGLRTKRGRMHEFDKVEAGTAIFTLNNAAGHFWRGNTAGDYYPDIRPLTLTRLRYQYKGTNYPVWYGLSESLHPRWVSDIEGGATPMMDMECVDFFKSFNRYFLTAANIKLTEKASPGDSHVHLENVDFLHEGQSVSLYQDDVSETLIINQITPSLNLVIFTTNVVNTYSAKAHVRKFPAVLAGQRIKDCLLEMDFPTALMDIDAGQHYVIAHTPPDEGTNILEHMQAVTEAEDGLLFQGRDGLINFQDASARMASPFNTSQVTFNDDDTPQKYVHPSLVDDDTFIYNEVKIIGPGIDPQQVVVGDAADEDGPRALVRKESQLYFSTDAFVQAFILAERFQTSKLRCDTLLIDPQADEDNLFPVILGYDLSTRVTFNLNTADNPAEIATQYHIEGVEHEWTPVDGWRTWWQLWTVNRYKAFSCIHDGYFRNYSDGGTYLEMQQAASANYVENDGSRHNPYTDADEIVVGQQLYFSILGFNGSLWRGFLEFDTSLLLSGDTPINAFIMLNIKESFIDDRAWNLVAVDPSTLTNPLIASDYGVLLSETTQQGAATMLRSEIWLIMALNANGLNLLVPEGVTRFGLRSNWDIAASDNDEADGYTNEYARFNNINTNYPPRLVIQLAE